MNGFFTAFDNLANGILNFFSYIISIAKEGIQMLLITLDFYNHTPQYLSWLPPGFATTIFIIIGAAICYRILGWGD